jgi:hypothetical protein
MDLASLEGDLPDQVDAQLFLSTVESDKLRGASTQTPVGSAQTGPRPAFAQVRGLPA